MSNLFGGGGSSAPAASAPALGPYPDDGAKRMPVFNSAASVESGRRKRREITGRQGRESTRLTGNKGTAAYGNSFLGSDS